MRTEAPADLSRQGLLLSGRRIAFGAVALAALVLRIWHIGWGLPDVFEEATPFVRGWGFWLWGRPGLDFNPHFFNYPALTFFLHWGAQLVHYAVGRLLGAYASLEAFHAAYGADPTPFIIVARSLNAVFDAGTVLLVMLFTRRLSGDAAALLAGGLSALNPLQIRLAQQINVDTPMTFFVVACLWFCLGISRTGSRTSYLAAGICAGLADACKYSAAPLAAVIVAVHCVRARRGGGILRGLVAADLLLALCAGAAVFLLLNPWMLLDPSEVRRGIGYEAAHLEAGHFGIAENTSSAGFYLFDVLPAAMGWIAAGAALIEVVAWWKRRDADWIAPLVWVCVFSVVLSVSRMRADRYLLPLIPVLLMLSAAGVRRAALAGGGKIRRAPAILMLLAGGAALGESGGLALAYHREAGSTDTRTLARAWLDRALPGESFIAMAPIGLEVRPPHQVLLLPYVAIGFDRFAPFYDARWFTDLDLVAGSDFDRGRYAGEPGRYAPFLRYFYDSLDVRWRLAGSFLPGPGTRGPSLWFYAPPAAPDGPLFGDDLMRRLDSVAVPRPLINFGWNLSSILYFKKKPEKAAQLWRRVGEIVVGRCDPAAALEAMSAYPAEIRSDPRFSRLMRAVAEKEAAGRR